jgi:hypothetical protein
MRRSGAGGLASDEMGEKREGEGRSRFWAAKWRDEPEKKPEARSQSQRQTGVVRRADERAVPQGIGLGWT